MAYTNFEQTTSVFAGEGDLVMFDRVYDYGTASLSTLAYPVSLGQVVQDSTEWEGENPEASVIRDEKGSPITVSVAPGTMIFSFDLASESLETVGVFLSGTRMPDFQNEWEAIMGFGVELPVMTRPLMILNDTLNRSWLYPKSKIVSTLRYEDGLWMIHAVVTVEYLDTPYLKSCMILEGDVENADYAGGDLLWEDDCLVLLESGDVIMLDG